MYRKLLTLALFVAAASLVATPAAAQAAQGTTDITIRMPSFVILYYQGSVELRPDNATVAALAGATATEIDEADSVPILDFTGSANVDGDGTAIGNATATLTNFWAVRSLAAPGPGTGTTVTVSFPTVPAGSDTLTNGTASMVMSNLDTRAPGSIDATFNGDGSSSFDATGLGLGALQLGDVRFEVDLTNATFSGDYTTGAIQIDAVNF